MNLFEKILLVDCFPDELDLFRSLLSGGNRSVLNIVSGGGDLVEKACAGDTSLVLIDMRLSVEKGLGAAEEIIKQKREALPFIFIISPETSEESILSRFRSTPVDFIVSPVKPALLRNKVEVFLALYRELRKACLLTGRLKERVSESSVELNKLKNAIEHCLEKVIVTSLDGEIEYVNPSFIELTGYRKEEVIGHKTSLLKSGRHGKEFYQSMWSTVLGGMVWQGEIINKRKDGELSFEHMTISPVYNNSQLTGFVAVQHDIGREKAFYERMIQAEKLSAIGTFVSGMAHEINNPLTAIMGYSDLLLRKKGVPEDIIEELQIILDQARRSSSLVKNLLNFSRTSGSSLKSRTLLDINKIVEDSVGLYRTRFRLDNIQLRIEYGKGRLYVYGYENRLQQVFVNIINNGHYALTSSQSARSAVFNVRTRFFGKRVKVVFENNGPHIPEKSLEKVFEPFFTSKDMEDGTGLGLSVSSGILNELGGTITVKNLADDSDENWKTGVRFEIELPVSSA